MSKPTKKTATRVMLEPLKDRTPKLGTIYQSDLWVVTTLCRGIKGKYIYSADVAMVLDKGKPSRIELVLLEITERKSSKNSKRDVGKLTPSKTGMQ